MYQASKFVHCNSWITLICLEVERVHQEVVLIWSMFMQMHGLLPTVRLQLELH
ncbi:hypothetical protein HanXRQr2_Chr11g0514061 [Helianthus annuus]|uniref:Uncharacterized protein n=1 Tax=Helianthus annuus TaxID=4232 RepID=A0A251TDA1_HELAN|nr:hypothetical protein HanXRQr2_Chr11g0514061 [Helianthus annuus]KAJ0877031.1 hypothetical protein HanPSC8_Chr11g0495451 [Helianthus annuus]